MADPVRLHSATPAELKAQIEAERTGAPFLVYRDGDRAQRIVALGEATRLTVGRDPANDIGLHWDPETSRLHAELERVGSEWTVADDGLSSNGTYVNGRRVTGRRRLQDRDEIRFGATVAVFRAPLAASLEETARPTDHRAAPSLTPAQRRVLVALCRPFGESASYASPATNQQIAAELVVTVDAVKANLRALFDQFEVEDLAQNRKRARLVELAFETGAINSRDLTPPRSDS